MQHHNAEERKMRHLFKKLTVWMLCLAMAVGMLPGLARGAKADDIYEDVAEGLVWNSTKTRFEISSYAGLLAFADIVNREGGNPSANAILLNDIDASASDTGSTWTPIGEDKEHKYTGTFDGQKNEITGLTTKDTNANYVGLFGYVGKKGSVQNVGMVEGSITGNEYVGGVVGRNEGTVTNCYNTASVSGGDHVGGVVGENSAGDDATSLGKVSNCYNTGTVSGGDCVGGVAGSNSYIVSNCYNTGAVSGRKFVGGVAGVSGGFVSNCYNIGTVSGGNYVGGVVGDSDGEPTHCYYLAGTANHNGYAQELDVAQFRDKASFEGWNFNTDWIMGAKGPMLRKVGTNVGTWSELYVALQTGGIICLSNDVTYGTGGGNNESYALEVPSGVTAILDLNGHTIDRKAGDTPVANGYVIKVEGDLTVCDNGTGGIITGGNTTDSGGGVEVKEKGAFTLRGGTIKDNSAEKYGGGVVIRRNGTLNMAGGTICGNKAVSGGGGVDIYQGTFVMADGVISGNSTEGDGGGMYIHGNLTLEGGTISNNSASNKGGGIFMYSGKIQMKGAPVISGNKKIETPNNTESPNNLFLEYVKTITVVGELTGENPIGVSMANIREFTSGLSGKGNADSFTSDNLEYGITLNDAGEAVLGRLVEIVAGEGMTIKSGADKQTVISGNAIADTVYTASEGYYFPTDYTSVGATNGLTVVRDSFTQITISGKPTESIKLTLSDLMAKTEPDAPSLVSTQLATIGDKGSIPTTAEYEFSSDGTNWTRCNGETTDLAPGTYYVRLAATDTELPSDAQKIIIISPGTIEFSGRVKLEGRSMTDADVFTFEVSEGGTVVATAQNDTDGNLTFSEIGYTIDDVGDHIYNVKQCATDIEGVTVDSTEYTVKVIVSYEPGDDAISVTPSEEFSGLYFSNTYENIAQVVTPKALTITADSASKEYDGTALTKGTVSAEGLADGDKIENITLTGTQTSVGTTNNIPSSAKIVNAAGEDVTSCYDITYVNGTLTVTKPAAPKLADDQKPAPKQDLKEDGKEQVLVLDPAKLPDGYTIEYSTDGGKTWKAAPTGTQSGEYTIEVKYTADGNHTDFFGDTLKVMIQGVYNNTESDGDWTKGSGKTYTFRIKKAFNDEVCFDNFTGVLVDGNQAKAGEDYTAVKGSTVITFAADYLETLTVGEHMIRVVFKDGEILLPLKILEAVATPTPAVDATPVTGDTANPFLFVALILMSMAGAAVIIERRRHSTGI